MVIGDEDFVREICNCAIVNWRDRPKSVDFIDQLPGQELERSKANACRPFGKAMRGKYS